jgi:hypothetical protein
MASKAAVEEPLFYVQYVGEGAIIRQITRAQWAKIGIDQDSAVWDKSNRHLIEKGFFGEAALDYLLNKDGDFRLVRADELD